MITVDNVSKRFGRTIAVDRLSFTIQPGIVTGFLGPNGAGKTTTMRMILGLDAPGSGSITVNGRSYRELPAPMFEVGALLDAKAVAGNATARGHLGWLAAAAGIPTSRVDEVLDLTGLASVANRRVGGFSLGMYQRLGIAAALLGDPRVLLFDEPVNGLDPEGIRWIRALLRDLAAEGRTVLLSSHLMSEMEETADHILVISRGRLVADCSLAEFTKQSASAHVRVVTPHGDALGRLCEASGATVGHEDGALSITGLEAPAIGAIAAANQIELHELTPRRATLEAAFMELTSGALEYRSVQSSPTTTRRFNRAGAPS